MPRRSKYVSTEGTRPSKSSNRCSRPSSDRDEPHELEDGPGLRPTGVRIFLLLLLIAGCDSSTVGEQVPADLTGGWRGNGEAADGSGLIISIEFYLAETGGQVSGTAVVGKMGAGTDRLKIEGSYEDVDLDLIITDSLTGQTVQFEGWASGVDMGGSLTGDPLTANYDATLKKFVAP